jgi:hypothetical protein
MDEDYEQLCAIHQVYESYNPIVDYLACGECFHVYKTPADLVNATNELADKIHLPEIKNQNAASIVVCAMCSHDFVWKPDFAEWLLTQELVEE